MYRSPNISHANTLYPRLCVVAIAIAFLAAIPISAMADQNTNVALDPPVLRLDPCNNEGDWKDELHRTLIEIAKALDCPVQLVPSDPPEKWMQQTDDWYDQNGLPAGVSEPERASLKTVVEYQQALMGCTPSSVGRAEAARHSGVLARIAGQL